MVDRQHTITLGSDIDFGEYALNVTRAGGLLSIVSNLYSEDPTVLDAYNEVNNIFTSEGYTVTIE